MLGSPKGKPTKVPYSRREIEGNRSMAEINNLDFGKQKESRSGSCGSCTLCCKLLGVKELSKPDGVWCKFCNKSGGSPGGCTIYANRPDSCQEFQCGYLINHLPEEFRPDRVKMVITGTSEEIGAHIIHVDPNYPGAYREGNGKRLIEALLAATSYNNVVLCIGNRRRFFGNNPEKIMARIAQLEKEGKIAL